MSHRTPESEARKAAVDAWLKARKELGTRKDLAHRLGLSLKTVDAIIWRINNPGAA